MYSTILADGRLRDLVNGHAPGAPAMPHSDALWGSALFDGTLGLSGVPVRGYGGSLGAVAIDGTGNAAANLVSPLSAAEVVEVESADIRRILSKTLPPRPSDVDAVRSHASFDISGAQCSQSRRFKHLNRCSPEILYL